MNDTFTLHAENIQTLHLRIYSRQGKLVFETKNIQEAILGGWDGTINGEEQAEGSYLWVLHYQDIFPGAAKATFSGNVTLIR